MSIIEKTGSFLRDILLSAMSAGVLILSYPPFGRFEFAWLAFVPLLFALENKSRKASFFYAYMCGLLFWLGTIYWLMHVTLVGMVLVAMYLSLYFGLFGFIAGRSRVTLSVPKVLFLSSIWVLLEFLRAHLLTGFPWALLGYSQTPFLPALQIADITGIWGVSFLVMASSVMIKGIISPPYGLSSLKKIPAVLFVCLFLAGAYGYGFVKLRERPSALKASVKVSVIQGNVPHEVKWRPESSQEVMARHLMLSEEAAKEQPNLLVWSEAALPVVLEKEPEYFERVKELAQNNGLFVLIGAITAQNKKFYNSALLTAPDGSAAGTYNKIHLVPFGEYTPLRSFLQFLENFAPIGQLTPGKEYTVFKLPLEKKAKFSVMICFEDLFPELARKFVKKGAGFLVNITNDAWYRKSAATYQHAQALKARAVENRVYCIRAANTGVSMVIDPYGRTVSTAKGANGAEIFAEAQTTAVIGVKDGRNTYYTRHGDIFIWACWVFVLFGMILFFFERI